MSNRLEISAVNRGLFNRDLLSKSVTDEHRKRARRIKEYFETAKEKNPLNLTPKQLDSLSEDDTIDYYIKPILEILGFKYRKKHQDRRARFPDVWLFHAEPEETNAEYLQGHNLTILEAKKYKVDLDIGDSRSERPPQQILSYISANQEVNPLKRWGILSNGYKWRLYSADGMDKYIEFDIDHALENFEELDLFCLVFSPESFKINRERSDVLSALQAESLDSWVRVTDEIEKRGNEILLYLVNAFYESGRSLEDSKEYAYDMLFRLLYTLYIESKHLVPKGSVKYTEKSLRSLLHAMHETTFEEYDISRWLNELFELFETGGGILSPGYGGEHFEKVPKTKLRNKWLAPALKLLTVFESEGSEVRFFDYSSLNVELIGNIYESTLALLFKIEQGRVSIKKNKRKTGTPVHSTGTTYTPPNVVKYLIEGAVDAKLRSVPTICDPACGSGHFLIQALRHLAKAIDFETTSSETLQEHKRKLAQQGLFGCDINRLATRLARLMLVIETAEKGNASADFRKNIREFNALLTKWRNSTAWLGMFEDARLVKKGGFDFVVGNPPYVRADEPGESKNREKIVESGQYKWLHKKWDLFIPFVELAVGLTEKSKGKVAYVVSDGITYAPYASKCVSELVASKHVEWVSHFSEAFENWAFPATCFVLNFSRREEKPERRMHDGNDPSKIVAINKVENPFVDSDKEEIADTVAKWPGLSIGDLYYVSVGMVLNSHEKLHTIDFEKDDLIKQGQADSKHPVRYLDNEDIGAGVLVRGREPRYIEYGPGLRAPRYIRRPTFPELHSERRLLLTRSKNSPSAFLATDDIVVSDNTIILKQWGTLSGIDNRQTRKKSHLSKKVSWLSVPKPFTDRVVFEELSGICSEELLLGILLSRLFKDWINKDRRHKHVIVPDVISEFPIPLSGAPVPDRRVPKYGLTFESELNKIEGMENSEAEGLIVFHIQNIVSELRGRPSAERGQVLLGYLDSLVAILFRPVSSRAAEKDYRIENVVKRAFESGTSKSTEEILEELNLKADQQRLKEREKKKAKQSKRA